MFVFSVEFQVSNILTVGARGKCLARAQRIAACFQCEAVLLVRRPGNIGDTRCPSIKAASSFSPVFPIACDTGNADCETGGGHVDVEEELTLGTDAIEP